MVFAGTIGLVLLVAWSVVRFGGARLSIFFALCAFWCHPRFSRFAIFLALLNLAVFPVRSACCRCQHEAPWLVLGAAWIAAVAVVANALFGGLVRALLEPVLASAAAQRKLLQAFVVSTIVNIAIDRACTSLTQQSSRCRAECC